MPTIYTEVEIDIDPDTFSDSEIIEDIRYRRNHKNGKERRDFEKSVIAAVSGKSGVMSLEDEIKTEMFDRNMRRISINDLDKFFGSLR